jgi:hypothetical protein
MMENHSRKACIEDFFDGIKTTPVNTHSQVHIDKNQQEFGNRKRIKP